MTSDSIGLSALTAFVEGTARAGGEGFFAALTRNLAQMLQVHDARVTELVGPRKVRTLACWSAGRATGNEERDVAGTPCEAVLAGEFRHHLTGVARQYPEWEKSADSYIGMPLKSEEGSVLGHLCAWDAAPMAPHSWYLGRLYCIDSRGESGGTIRVMPLDDHTIRGCFAKIVDNTGGWIGRSIRWHAGSQH